MSTVSYRAVDGKVYARVTGESPREVTGALSANGRDLARFEAARVLAAKQRRDADKKIGRDRTSLLLAEGIQRFPVDLVARLAWLHEQPDSAEAIELTRNGRT